MGNRLRLRHPLSIPRLMLGAVITIGGIVLMALGHFISGMLVAFLGIGIGIRGSSQAILWVLTATLTYGLFITALFLLSTFRDDRTFADWSQDSIAHYVFLAVYIGIMIFNGVRSESSAWAALEDSYADLNEWSTERNKYPMATGLLVAHDDQFEVTAIATERGLVISRNLGGACLVIPWERMISINPLGSRKRTAELEIARSTPLPLSMKVPWDKAFDRFTQA